MSFRVKGIIEKSSKEELEKLIFEEVSSPESIQMMKDFRKSMGQPDFAKNYNLVDDLVAWCGGQAIEERGLGTEIDPKELYDFNIKPLSEKIGLQISYEDVQRSYEKLRSALPKWMTPDDIFDTMKRRATVASEQLANDVKFVRELYKRPSDPEARFIYLLEVLKERGHGVEPEAFYHFVAYALVRQGIDLCMPLEKFEDLSYKQLEKEGAHKLRKLKIQK